jgi:hypothetical protein
LRIVAVIKVVAVVVVDINVVGGIPVIGPVFRPWIHQQEGIPAVLETRVPQIHHRARPEPEVVLAAEIEAEGLLRNVGTAVASALRPGAMVGGPPLCAILLEGVVPLPAALLQPSPLLLP